MIPRFHNTLLYLVRRGPPPEEVVKELTEMGALAGRAGSKFASRRRRDELRRHLATLTHDGVEAYAHSSPTT